MTTMKTTSYPTQSSPVGVQRPSLLLVMSAPHYHPFYLDIIIIMVMIMAMIMVVIRVMTVLEVCKSNTSIN